MRTLCETKRLLTWLGEVLEQSEGVTVDVVVVDEDDATTVGAAMVAGFRWHERQEVSADGAESAPRTRSGRIQAGCSRIENQERTASACRSALASKPRLTPPRALRHNPSDAWSRRAGSTGRIRRSTRRATETLCCSIRFTRPTIWVLVTGSSAAALASPRVQ